MYKIIGYSAKATDRAWTLYLEGKSFDFHMHIGNDNDCGAHLTAIKSKHLRHLPVILGPPKNSSKFVLKSSMNFRMIFHHGCPCAPEHMSMKSFSQIDTSGITKSVKNVERSRGLVLIGKWWCENTTSAVNLCIKHRLGFQYLDADQKSAIYMKPLEGLLCGETYMFEAKTSSCHLTVPIIILDGVMLGGRDQLVNVIKNKKRLESVVAGVNKCFTDCVYIPLDRIRDKVAFLSILSGLMDNKVPPKIIRFCEMYSTND